jgi:hypothetical protein
MRKHYGIQWLLNGVDANTGARCANYYWFATRSERDNWVSEGAPYRGAGFRETLPANDLELRLFLRRDQSDETIGLNVQPWSNL